jgi:hypothetical protein
LSTLLPIYIGYNYLFNFSAVATDWQGNFNLDLPSLTSSLALVPKFTPGNEPPAEEKTKNERPFEKTRLMRACALFVMKGKH